MTALATQHSHIDAATLRENAGRLQRRVMHHKTAIKRHREQLHDAKSQLVALEAKCRDIGIRLIVQE